MDLSVAAKQYFNRTYRDARTIAKNMHCRFPPYAVAFKRAVERAGSINAMVLTGRIVGPLDPFWRDIFGGSISRGDLRVLREVHWLMAQQAAVPDRCESCNTIGPVVIDAASDGVTRGWLCESCSAAARACGDPGVLHGLADYLSRVIAKQNQSTNTTRRRVRQSRAA